MTSFRLHVLLAAWVLESPHFWEFQWSAAIKIVMIIVTFFPINDVVRSENSDRQSATF